MYNIKVKSLLPDLYEQLDSLIKKNVFYGKNVYVFGKAIWGYAVTCYLQMREINVSGVIDNNPKTGDFSEIAYLSINAQLKYKVGIKTPEEMLGGLHFDDNAVIVLSNKFYTSQANQLMKMGYKETDLIMIDKEKQVEIDADFCEYERVGADGIKKELFELLQYFKKICDDNNLTYYLTEGTLLGAIRHKGFIPWDDDIDVSMPLEDYFKLNDIFKSLNSQNGKYALYSMLLDKNCVYAYSKLVNTKSILYLHKYPMSLATHINIDIFPLSGAPMEGEAENIRFLNDLKNFKM